MNSFIFVAVLCMNQQCTFLTSTRPITEKHCVQLKKEFMSLPLKPEVTTASAQCMEFDDGKVKV